MTSLEGGEPAIYWVKMTQRTSFKCDLMWRCIYCKLAELVCKLSVTQMSSYLYFPVLWMIPQKQKDFAVGSTLGALFAKFKSSKSYQHIGNRVWSDGSGWGQRGRGDKEGTKQTERTLYLAVELSPCVSLSWIIVVCRRVSCRAEVAGMHDSPLPSPISISNRQSCKVL